MNKVFIALFFSYLILAHSQIEKASFMQIVDETLSLKSENNALLDVLYGILEGLSEKGPESKCRINVERKMDTILKIYKNILNGLKEGKSIEILIIENMFDLLKLVTLVNDCRLIPLMNVLMNLLTDKGIEDLLQRIKDHEDEVLDLLRQVGKAMKEENNTEVGIGLGKLIKLILEWHVNVQKDFDDFSQLTEEDMMEKLLQLAEQ